MLRSVLVVVWLLTPPVTTDASPIVFDILPGGTATAFVSLGGSTIADFGFSGMTGSVTLDSSTSELLQVDMTIGGSNLVTLSTPYGGYDEFRIAATELDSSTGFSSSVVTETAGTFHMTAGPVTVETNWDRGDSTGGNPASVATSTFDPVDLLTLATPLAGGNVLVQLNTILAVIDPATFSLASPETQNLITVGDFSFEAAPVPEPAGLLLLACGIAVVAATGRRRQS
ncbi:MAG: hypothetical protein CMJ81_08920 [Planctomycetaceae bacterium]|jgi:hypothetical protein|nr:hypothetical protein [Planctomycetaceae bacterium]